MKNIKRNIIIGAMLIIVPLIITAMLAAHNNLKNIDYPDGCHVRGGVVWYHNNHTNVSALKCMEAN